MPKKYRLKTSAALAVLMAARCFAQTVAEPAFDVASVRANTDPGGDRPGRPIPEISGGTLIFHNEPLFLLIEWAYDLPPLQIEAPSWITMVDPRFEITAKTGGDPGETQMRIMLRRLLADRLGLKTHTESRNMQVYALTLAKGGPKFQASTDEGPFILQRTNNFVLNAHRARMADLAQGFSGEVGRPVVDETGLPGRYEIHIDFAPYIQRTADGGNGGQLDVQSIMFTGLQEILGLKLEPRKENVNILVIDHAEKIPTEN
jgi:uncharacterized protein (TIGR03435 family)